MLFAAEPPPWLADPNEYQRACNEEISIYEDIDRLLTRLSDGRERAKAALFLDLLKRHRIVLGFDSHLITLTDLKRRLKASVDDDGIEVAIATARTRSGGGGCRTGHA